MSDDSSPLVNMVLVFVFAAIVLAILGLSQYILLATNVFVFVFIDHVQGLVVGGIISGILGSLAAKEVKVGGFTFSVGAILGIMVQYYLFH